MEAKKFVKPEGAETKADVRADLFDVVESKAEQLLAQRAKRMAERKDEHANDTHHESNAQSIIIFSLGGERFAFRMGSVSAVVPLAKLTTVPTADSKILGAMVVKGEVHCIFDLARIIDLPRTPSADKSNLYVIILRMPGFHIGFAVDQIEAIDGIEADSQFANQVSATREIGSGRSFVKPKSSNSLVLIENFKSLLAPYLHEEN